MTSKSNFLSSNSRSNLNKKAQIEVTFNWMYVLIAGGVILLFFVGLIVKFQSSSEDNLSYQVVRTLESIFSASGVSDKTKNFIDTSGLADYTLYFDCENGVSSYGIEGRPAAVTDEINPIFSPSKLSSPRLITWSLPYKLPYKVMDFLMITSENTVYYVLGEGEFATEFIKSTAGVNQTSIKEAKFNVEQIQDLSMADPGKNYQLRIIDLAGMIKDYQPLPKVFLERVSKMDDDKITAISIIGNKVDYYQKKGDVWSKMNKNEVWIISLGEDKDAAKYAAVFSGTPQIYQCNMYKAFRRLAVLNEVYGGKEINAGGAGGKLGQVMQFYVDNPQLNVVKECSNFLSDGSDSVKDGLQVHYSNTVACVEKYKSSKNLGGCVGLINSAQMLKNANANLAQKGDCITLY